MTGYRDMNKREFFRVAKQLRSRGFKVFCPPEEEAKEGSSLDHKPEWDDSTFKYIRRDLKGLLQCQKITLLQGWEKSRGASLEVMIAKELGLSFVDSKGKTTESPSSHSDSILMEAERIVNGPRQKAYGHPLLDFSRTAALWSAILGVQITPEQVALCMVALKISRECNRHTRDNLVDMAGYAATLALVVNKKEELARQASLERIANG